MAEVAVRLLAGGADHDVLAGGQVEQVQLLVGAAAVLTTE